MKTSTAATILLTGVFAFSAAAFSADDATGTVSGLVKDRSVARYPTLVYIEKIPGRTFNPPASHAVMDQKGKEFIPHVLPILAGTTVEFLNSDSFEHNVFCPDGEEYDLGKWGQGGKRSHTFEQPGVFTQLCRIHPEMVGYVVVVKTPHFAVTDEEGKFQIPEVPTGTWTLKIWNERLRPKQLKKAFPVDVGAGREVTVNISF